MPYPAKPEGQNDTQAAPHPFISDADFGLSGDVRNTDENLSGYKNVERGRPLDDMSNLESGDEKVVLVRSVRTKDAD